MKRTKWIEFSGVLAGFVLISLAGLIPLAEDPDQQDSGIAPFVVTLNEIATLEKQLDDLAQKGTDYLEAPPREYEMYFRDAAVVHPMLMRDVEGIDRTVDRILSSGDNGQKGGNSRLNDGAGIEPQLHAVSEAWEAFQDEFAEQLGVDPEMPRLEWGARHLAEQTGTVKQPAQALSETLRQKRVTGDDPQSSPRAEMWAPLATLVWALLALVWFRLRANETWTDLQSGA